MRGAVPRRFRRPRRAHLLPPGPGMAGVWVWPPGRLVSPVPRAPGARVVGRPPGLRDGAPEHVPGPAVVLAERPVRRLGGPAPHAGASTWAPRRAARCEFGRTSQGTGTVPAPCSGQSVLGTARRAWVPDCQTPGWRQVRSRASRAPQGTPHPGQGTAWPRLLATLTWC